MVRKSAVNIGTRRVVLCLREASRTSNLSRLKFIQEAFHHESSIFIVLHQLTKKGYFFDRLVLIFNRIFDAVTGRLDLRLVDRLNSYSHIQSVRLGLLSLIESNTAHGADKERSELKSILTFSRACKGPRTRLLQQVFRNHCAPKCETLRHKKKPHAISL